MSCKDVYILFQYYFLQKAEIRITKKNNYTHVNWWPCKSLRYSHYIPVMALFISLKIIDLAKIAKQRWAHFVLLLIYAVVMR